MDDTKHVISIPYITAIVLKTQLNIGVMTSQTYNNQLTTWLLTVIHYHAEKGTGTCQFKKKSFFNRTNTVIASKDMFIQGYVMIEYHTGSI